LSPARFLTRHWQKSPLLIRGGLTDIDDFVDLSQLIDLACRDDCQSRLVVRHGEKWRIEHGPLEPARFRRLPRAGWTLLVQGVEQFVPAGRALLDRFSFIPHARLDDLMVSYAPPGAGVGPHFDHYDVFLLQGPGRRRWQISHQADLQLRADLPLKILRQFVPQGECVLEKGDLLYLPPQWAHDGVSIDAGLTYSVGFRAPDYQQLARAFVAWLDDQISVDGRYEDPRLRPASHPGQLPRQMLSDTVHLLEKLRWGKGAVRDFLGGYLSEPKDESIFTPPSRPISRKQFSLRLRRCVLSLSLQSNMLYLGRQVFINGEQLRCDAQSATVLAELADARVVTGERVECHPPLLETVYSWYRAGYVVLRQDGHSRKI
jgi:50S ribosomal protein L16 3-hydroxylase